MDDTDTALPPHLRTLAAPALAGARGDDEYSAFAGGRVSARPLAMVTFRTAAGAGLTVAYSHLYGVSDDGPEAGFTLEFTRHYVAVRGRHLGRLFRLLGEHRVREVRAADPLHAQLLPVGEPVVTALEVRPKADDPWSGPNAQYDA